MFLLLIGENKRVFLPPTAIRFRGPWRYCRGYLKSVWLRSSWFIVPPQEA